MIIRNIKNSMEDAREMLSIEDLQKQKEIAKTTYYVSDITRGIQLLEIKILEEVQRLCKKYGLRYFAIGGTCLGAVRHGGFIPWDDDIDIAMPYDDYIKFRKIAKNELKPPYALFDPYEHRHSRIGFYKIHDTTTTFVEQIALPYTDRYTGVFIDVMPIYGLPNREQDALRTARMCSWWLRKNIAMRFSYNELLSNMEKVMWLLTYYERKTKHYSYYLKKIEEECDKFSFDSSEQVLFGFRIIPFREKASYTYKVIFPYSIFSDFLEVPFENTTIRIPYGYQQYLTMDFGNYMRLPPEDKRVTVHPAALIDLNKSYKEYIKEAKQC